MQPLDFIVIMICCLAWAGNFVVSAWALGAHPIPPFMLAAVRAIIVLCLMGPFLFRKPPKNFHILLLVCACVGPLHLGFLYTGLQTASASGGSIVAQMMIPIATVLSVIILRETIGWTRGLAIFGAFIGVMVMVYDPAALELDMGLFYILLAYISLAFGSVMMKRVGDVDWRLYVAWMAVMVAVTMIPFSLLFETDQNEVLRKSLIPLLIAAGYAGLAVTIFAHGQYFKLIGKYPVSVVVPLTLVMPLFTCILGVWLLGEAIILRYYIGAALIIPCVYIIAKRQRVKQ